MKKLFRITIIVAIVGIIAALLVYKFVYNKPHPDYVKAKPQFSINAEELFRAYQAGEPESARYNGSVIQVQGGITRIESLDSLVIAVMVFDEGLFGDEGIRFTMLSEYHGQTKDLKTGQSVTIKGLCTGYNDTDVILEKCSIVN